MSTRRIAATICFVVSLLVAALVPAEDESVEFEGFSPAGERAIMKLVDAVKPSPNPIECRDIGSDTTNDQVAPGNIGQLSGSRLKYDEAYADQGVFFAPTAGGEAVDCRL